MNQQIQSLLSEYHDRSWEVSETSRSVDEIKDGRSTLLKWSSSMSKSMSKSSSTIPDKKSLFPWLPREERRKDKERRIVIPWCHCCDGWYFDLDCSKRSRSFSIKTALNQSPDSNISLALDNDDYDLNSTSSYFILLYSNGECTPKSCSQMVLLQAEKFAILQIPVSEAVGTGVFYLSVESCPVKTWVGMEPYSNVLLSSGVVSLDHPTRSRSEIL